MKNTDLYNAISDINPEYLEEINDTNIHKKHLSKKTFIAILCAVVGVLGVTAYAAITYDFGLGFRDMEITPSQGQELIEKDAAIIYTNTSDTPISEENIDYSSLVVTSNGITISPEAVIVDERYAYISFKVSGFDYDEDNGPWIEHEPVFEKGQPDKELWAIADFIVFNRYEGYPYECCHAEDGNLYFIVYATTYDINDSMLGKTLEIHINRLEEGTKCTTIRSIEGNWDFEITLPKGSTSVHKDINKKIDDNFILDSIDISPISIQMNYTVTGIVDNGTVPYLHGFIMKDGSEILTNSGINYSQSNNPSKFINTSYFDKSIDYNEIDCLEYCRIFKDELSLISIN